jgi:hypothetical protein
LQTYNVKKDALKILLFVGVPLAVAAFILWRLAIIKIYENGDFTNAFGFFIEIGVAVFISVLLFKYSSSQQDKSTGILATVSDTTNKLKQLSDSLEEQKQQRSGVVLNAISNTLSSMWNTSQMALFVTYKNGFKEEDFDEKLSEYVRSNLRDHRRRIANNLAHLENLMLLGSEGLDAKLISALFDFRNSISFLVLTETTLTRAAHPCKYYRHICKGAHAKSFSKPFPPSRHGTVPAC